MEHIITTLKYIITYNDLIIICVGLLLIYHAYHILSCIYDVIAAIINTISFTYCIIRSSIERHALDPDDDSKPDLSSGIICSMLWKSFKMFYDADDITIISDSFTWISAFNFTTYKKFIKQQ
jgi:hypothetical protein